MADELDFGSPATSARTSSDDFTPTTLTGFADTSLDHTGNTLGDNTAPARTAGTMPHVGVSPGDTAARRTPLQRAISTGLRTRSDVGSADPRTFVAASAGAQRFDTRATGRQGTALFVGGVCGDRMAQENPDLAGIWQDSGGLFGATAAEEEAEMEEGRVVDAGRLHHQDAASNISNGDVGGDHSTFGAATQLQQIAQHQWQPTAAAGTQANAMTAVTATASGSVLHHQDATGSISKNDMDDSLGGGGGNSGDGDQQQQMSQQMRWANSGGPAVSLGNSSVSLDVGRPGAQTVAADLAEAPAAVLARAMDPTAAPAAPTAGNLADAPAADLAPAALLAPAAAMGAAAALAPAAVLAPATAMETAAVLAPAAVLQSSSRVQGSSSSSSPAKQSAGQQQQQCAGQQQQQRAGQQLQQQQCAEQQQNAGTPVQTIPKAVTMEDVRKTAERTG